ncbi:uncharacterized protein LOC133518056 isoform X2 [Cydia pomonella]|uniref:uncharacterized protein LOC133518056 isoform X2 n=1 Tax=Cydia pomonella TaxID=82600 RepID=UPI002ADDA744|nr:uncharacterized protein LOC133518056 isoform X2 [Cydia pomonella]
MSVFDDYSNITRISNFILLLMSPHTTVYMCILCPIKLRFYYLLVKHHNIHNVAESLDRHTCSLRPLVRPTSERSGCENTFSSYGNGSSGVNTVASSHTPRYVNKMDSDDNAKALARSILGPAKDADFLASFVRVGIADEEEEDTTPKASISKRAPQSADKSNEVVEEEKHSAKERKVSPKPRKKSAKRKQKRERRRREEEVYTDKDRAAAVVMGSRDIKQSLSMKDKAERSSALQLPEEADAGTLLALARAEMTRERYKTAFNFVNKAIELAPEEKAAYVARSKCHLLLGEPRAALADAERALALDPKHGKALLHKAEALYYCGEFEMSLVHYHRGLRARPDLNEFRLGVQKAQVSPYSYRRAYLVKCFLFHSRLRRNY